MTTDLRKASEQKFRRATNGENSGGKEEGHVKLSNRVTTSDIGAGGRGEDTLRERSQTGMSKEPSGCDFVSHNDT